jgi:Tfp pilus assembly protein PilV
MHAMNTNPGGTLSRNRNAGKASFTLMEVAIAVAVVLIGVLALFALITSGLESSAKSVADTQAALFADNVFNGLAAASEAAAQKGMVGGNSAWRQFWDDFVNNRPGGTLMVAAPSTWAGAATSYRIQPIVAVPRFRTLRFQVLPQHDPSIAGIVNHALRYALTVRYRDPIAPLTNPENDRVMVTLKIWDGEFGPANPSDNDALIFYSEFDNPGDL